MLSSHYIKKSILVPFILIMMSSHAVWAARKPWQESRVGPITRAICDRVDRIPFPAQDQPTKTEKGGPSPCQTTSARDLYYGIGRTADPQNARLCAFLERSGAKRGEVDLTSGSAILAMIYANGRGVPKNLDLAQKAACEASFFAEDTQEQIKHLEALKSLTKSHPLEECVSGERKGDYCAGKFDMCDDISSTLMGVFCADIESDLAESRNKALFRKTTSLWPTSDQKAFETLEKNAVAYFQNHAYQEIDRGGTMRETLSREEYDSYLAQFRADIVSFEKGKKLIYSQVELAQADADLNAVYKRTLRLAPKDANVTDILDKGIRETQRSWLVYRDAWVKFAASHYPHFTAESIKTWLTRQRTGVLKNIPSAFGLD